jgi:hypothetical protein
MEGAQAYIVFASLPQHNVFGNDINDVSPQLYFLNGVLMQAGNLHCLPLCHNRSISILEPLSTQRTQRTRRRSRSLRMPTPFKNPLTPGKTGF